jgi:reactive intermediate/imine deaminase
MQRMRQRGGQYDGRSDSQGAPDDIHGLALARPIIKGRLVTQSHAHFKVKFMPDETLRPQPLVPGGHLPANLPFSEGIAVGNLVFLSGQIGTLPGKRELNNVTREAEFRQVMDNIVRTLNANGMTTKNVVKCLVMLEDMKDWEAFNQVYVTYFEPPHPARSAFGTTGLAFGARAEVECIAVR